MTTSKKPELYIRNGGSWASLKQQLDDIGRKAPDRSLVPRVDFWLAVAYDYRNHPGDGLVSIGVTIDGIRVHPRIARPAEPHLFIIWGTISDKYLSEEYAPIAKLLEPLRRFEAYYDIGTREGKMYPPRN